MDECHLGGGCLGREAACHSDKAIIFQPGTAEDSDRCFLTEQPTFCNNYGANRTLIKVVNVRMICLFIIAGSRPCTIISWISVTQLGPVDSEPGL